LPHQPPRRLWNPTADQKRADAEHNTDRDQSAPADSRSKKSDHRRADEKAQRDRTGHEPGHDAAFTRRYEFLDQGNVNTIETSRAEANQEAENAEIDPADFGRVRRDDQGRHADAEHADRRQEHAPAADPVGETTEIDRPNHRADA
jgi:hypothetical protein